VRFVSIRKGEPPGRLDPVEKPVGPRFREGEELRVRVGGMSQALKGELIDFDETGMLRFRCPLPFLRLRSPVTVRSVVSEDGRFEGEVHAVEASAPADGVPEIVVTVCAPLEQPSAAGPCEAAGIGCGSAAVSSIAEPGEGDPMEEPVIGLRSPRAAVEPPAPVPDGTGGADAPASGGAARPSVLGAVRTSVLPRAAAMGRSAAGGLWIRLLGFLRWLSPRIVRGWRVSVAAASGGASWLWAATGRGARRLRRSRLPRTYSDVVQRGTVAAGVGRKRLVNALAAGLASAGLALALWGIFGPSGARGGTVEPDPGGAAAGGTGTVASSGGDWGGALPSVPDQWPAAAGEDGAVAAGAVEPDPEPDPEPVAAPVEAPAPAGPVGPAQEAPAQAPPAGLSGGQSFILKLDGPALRVQHYALREPPGVVIDVIGARSAEPGPEIPVRADRVRLVKAIEREGGSRFVVYVRGRTTPRYTAWVNGSEVVVTLAR
jgi:hypothetical protein